MGNERRGSSTRRKHTHGSTPLNSNLKFRISNADLARRSPIHKSPSGLPLLRKCKRETCSRRFKNEVFHVLREVRLRVEAVPESLCSPAFQSRSEERRVGK